MAEIYDAWGESGPSDWPGNLKDTVIVDVDAATQQHLSDCTECRFQSKFERRKLKRGEELDTSTLELPDAAMMMSLCKDGMAYMETTLGGVFAEETTKMLTEVKDLTEKCRPARSDLTALEKFGREHSAATLANLLAVKTFHVEQMAFWGAKSELVSEIENEDKLMLELQTTYEQKIMPMAKAAELKGTISNSTFYVVIPEVFTEFVDKKFAANDGAIRAKIPAFEKKHGTFLIDGKEWAKTPCRALLGPFSVSQDIGGSAGTTAQSVPSVVGPTLKVPGGPSSARNRSPSPGRGTTRSPRASKSPSPRALKSSPRASKSPSPRTPKSTTTPRGKAALTSKSGQASKNVALMATAADKVKDVAPGVPIDQPSILIRSDTPDWFERLDEFAQITDKVTEVAPEDSCMQCITRIRPLVWHEQKAGHVPVVQANPDGRTIRLTQKLGGKEKQHDLSFLKVCNGDVKQTTFFEDINAKKLMDLPLKGINSCMFAYGQTGSGKTYSMAGPMDVLGLQTNAKLKPFEGFPEMATNALNEMLVKNLKEQGLMPKLAFYLFEEIRKLETEDPNVRFQIRASYVQVYNEQVQDLLSRDVKDMPVRERVEVNAMGYYAEGLTEQPVNNLEEMLDLFVSAAGNRIVTSHKMNSESSRSHALLTIFVEKLVYDPDGASIRATEGKLCMVDLAGSESVKGTGTSGKSLQETAGINKSLLSLSNIVATLAAAKGDPAGVSGWRNSKLTMLLMDSLIGAGYTMMLACCSPSSQYQAETLSTLQFATRVANISKSDVAQLTPHEMEIKKLHETISSLRALVKKQAEMLAAAGVSEDEVPKRPGMLKKGVSFSFRKKRGIGNGGTMEIDALADMSIDE